MPPMTPLFRSLAEGEIAAAEYRALLGSRMLDPFVESAVSNVYPPVLWAPVTFVYTCRPDMIDGTDCTAHCDVRATIAFPTEIRTP